MAGGSSRKIYPELLCCRGRDESLPQAFPKLEKAASGEMSDLLILGTVDENQADAGSGKSRAKRRQRVRQGANFRAQGRHLLEVV